MVTRKRFINYFLNCLFSVSLLGLLLACGSVDKKSDALSKSYITALKKNIIQDEVYSGFRNIFSYKAALLTKDVYAIQIEKDAYENLWDEDVVQKERQEFLQTTSNSTEVMLSFFAPEKKNMKLEAGKSIWRIFLDVGNKRYIGKVKKVSGNPSQVRTKYPFHSPWSELFIVRFPVPLAQTIEHKPVLTITGNLGVSRQSFK